MIEALRKNVETEIGMLREISVYINQKEHSQGEESKQIGQAIDSLQASIKLINDSIPNILQSIDYAHKLPVTSTKTGLEQITLNRAGNQIIVHLQSKDKERFIKELSINTNLIKKLKKRDVQEKNTYEEFKAARGYLKLSNKLFFNTSRELIKKGYFTPLNNEIKKANLDLLFETYVAMMIFTTFLSIGIGFLVMLLLLFFDLSISWPYLSVYGGSFLSRLIEVIWIPIVAPIATFIVLYFYPSTERSVLEKHIDLELPFAVIHMSAISGSGISPSEIFKIIGLSKEYPFLRREIRKVLNQTNIYGYDLVTALNNVSKSTPSQRLAELFNGMATTINSGGNLSEFFDKRAETLLAKYRTEREKFNHTAETFMDIYISVVIATPMILMLLLVMIQMTGINTGFSTNMIAFIIIAVVALINVLFLGFLQVKQPVY